MAVLTCSGREILMRLGAEMGETRGFRIVTGGSSISASLALPTSTTDQEYRWAFAKTLGKGLSQVTNQFSTGVVSFSPAFSGNLTAGDVLGLALWNANKLQAGLEAINDFIYATYPYVYREVLLDANHSTLSTGATHTFQELSADTNEYALPTDLAGMYALHRIGVQPDAERPWTLNESPRDLWRVYGEEGNLFIRFFNNGRLYIPSAYAGEDLCLHYMAREPLLTDLTTSSCRIPVDAFAGAAEMIKRRWLFRDSRGDQAIENVALPQLQMAARQALARVGAIRSPLAYGPEYGYLP